MPRKSISTFFKGLRSKSHGRNDPAGSSSNVPDHGETERGQSLQLNRHSIFPQSGRSTNTPAHSMDATHIDTDDRKKNATSPEEIWDEAYDGLKAEQPQLMHIYEVILSNKLHDPNSDHPQSENETNTIATAGDERRAQMEAKIKESVGEAMEIAAPQAALPWSIVSMALDIVQNPVKAQKDNIEGIAYTTKRMKWYWSLSSDLFHGDGSLRNRNDAPDTQNGILLRLVGLYKEIILFQLFPDFVIKDNWNDSLKEIRTLELEFQNDYATYMTLEEKKRLLDTKGGLLPDSYTWAVKSAMFRQWHTEKETNLLWIKGNPGKGKTLMICGLIEELEHMEPHQDLLSHFFCQGTDPNFNNATAPSLIEHIQQEYKNVGSRSLFDGINAWITLSGVFVKMLQDPALENACLIKLLDFIIESTLATPQVKWILSSRNYPDIEAKIRSCRTIASVDAYIRCRTQQLSLIEDNEVLQEQLQRAILQKSSGTFLWAALVFQEIEERRTYDDDAELLQLLDAMPSGLSGLYERMMNQINLLVNSDQERCRNILATMSECVDHFLTIRRDVVYFVHQSAKDYLIGEGHNRIFPSGSETVHRDMFNRSLEAMLKPGKLRPNIYSLPYPGVKIHEISVPQPDPLASIMYCCMHWLQHFCDGTFGVYSGSKNHIHEGVNKIFDFLKLHFLHWIEALNLSQNVEAGVVSLQNLLNLLTHNVDETEAIEFFQDALRFILYNRFILETAPLQVYISANIFAPMKSHIRLHFKEAISWIKTLPPVDNYWSSCQYTLYCGIMTDAVFSNDTSQLITLSLDEKMKRWETTTGKLIPDIGYDFKLPPDEERSLQLTLSDDAKLLAISDDLAITVWDLESGKQVQGFKIQRRRRSDTAFSGDSMLLAVTDDTSFQIWELATGKMVKTPRQKYPSRVLLSQDFKLAAWKTTDSILISNVATGEKIYELSSKFHPTHFSNNSSYLVALDTDKMEETPFQVWHISSGEKIIRYISRGPLYAFRSIAFSDDSKFLAFGEGGENINIWNLEEKAMVRSYSGHTHAVSSIAFSRDASFLVSGSLDRTVKVWKTDFDSIDRPPQSELGKAYHKINALALSTDGNFTATMSREKITFWSTRQLSHIQSIWQSKDLTLDPLAPHRGHVLAISKDSRLVARVYIFYEHDDSQSIGMSIWSIDSESPATGAFRIGGCDELGPIGTIG
ncbi:hypothetical protein CI102_9159 [Trichoderma harzianum]|nr:hypothetical protein CI102_9159 [Trichoderma harzianum]